MVLAEAVELHARVSADGSIHDSSAHASAADLARCPGYQRGKLVHAASAHRTLRDLLPGNHIALFTRLGLYAHRVSFNGHSFLSAADLHGEIDAVAISYLQSDV